MTLTINGKEYKIHAGLDFIAALDRKHSISQSGVTFGIGVTTVAAQLEAGNPLILLDVIQAGTITEKNPPVLQEIKDYIENDVEDVEVLMKDFLSLLETAPMTRGVMKRLREQMAPQRKAKK